MTASPQSAGEPQPIRASALSGPALGPGAHPAPWDRRYGIALAGLMLCLVAFFWQHLFTAGVLYLRDVSFLHYPHAVELRSIVRSGHLPLWNPFEHFGEAVASNPDYLLFYPTAWLAWILPPAYGFKLHYVIHFSVFAAGAFLLARRYGGGPLACFAAGALGVFSGPILSLGNLYNHVAGAAWLPFSLLAADRLARAPARPDHAERGGGWLHRSAPLAACLALQVLAGSPDFAVASAVLAAAWILAFHARLREPVFAPVNRALLARYGAALGLAAALAAVQLVPALTALSASERAGAPGGALFWSAHPLQLAGMLFPDLWGAPLPGGATPWLLFDAREPFLYSTFIGLIAVILAAFALLIRTGQDRLPRWLALTGGACVIVALGRYTPAGHLFYDVLPVFKVLRYPAKLLVPAALAITQLAALGIDRILTADRTVLRAKARFVRGALIALAVAWGAAIGVCIAMPRFAIDASVRFASLFFSHQLVLEIGGFRSRQALLTAAAGWLPHALRAQFLYVAGVTLLFALIGSRRIADGTRRLVVLAAALLAVAQPVFVNLELNGVADPRMFSDPPSVAALIPRGLPPPRVYVEKSGTVAVDVGQVAFLPEAAAAVYAYRMNLEIGAAMSGFETPWSADVERVLPRDQELLRGLPRRSLPPGGLTRLLQLSGTQYAVLTHSKPPSEFALAGVARTAPGGAARVYRIPGAEARAWLVPADGAVVERPGASTIARLLDAQFDPRRQVVLDSTVPAGLARLGREPATADASPAGVLPEVRQWNAAGIQLHAAANAPCYLVVAAAYGPGWHAYVDGQLATVVRANQMFRAVALRAGQHDIRFVYRPVALYAGAGISFVTLLFLAVGWRAERRKVPLPRAAAVVR